MKVVGNDNLLNSTMSDFNELLLPDLNLNTTGFDFDIENPFSQSGDALNQLISDLEIPMLFDEGHGGTPSPTTSTPSSVAEDEMLRSSLKLSDCWGTDLLPSDWDNIKLENIKLEPDSLLLSTMPPSPSASNSSDSGDSGVHCWLNGTPKQKVVIDTPPVSPPTNGNPPPLSSVTVQNNVGNSPLVMISTVNLIPVKPAGILLSTPQTTQKPKIKKIQPRPIKSEPIDSPAVTYEPRIKVVAKQDLLAEPPTKVPTLSVPLKQEPMQADVKVPISSIFIPRPSLPSNQVELKLMKKHQRMIKNRESATLSRRKKKEYVMSLEQEIDMLKDENYRLILKNVELRKRLAVYESRGKPSKASKGALTALCAILIFASVNLGPLAFFNGRSVQMPLSEDLTAIPPRASRSHGRSLLWAVPELNTSIPNMHTCPVPINQTESIRLDSELRGWFEEELGHSGDLKDVNVTAVTKMAPLLLPLTPPPQIKLKTRKRKISKRHVAGRRKVVPPGAEVALYSGPQRYAALMDAIRRRDDTFYVVSLSGEHLLLPARAHNQTLRPKVSLVLPTNLAGNSSSSSHRVALMQIDCEVTDTRLLHVDENFMQAHFRANSTQAPVPPLPSPSPSTNPPRDFQLEQVLRTHRALFKHYP